MCGALAEHHEVGVAVGQALVVDDLGVLEPHLRRQLLGGPARRQAVGDGQGEAELDDPVAEMVGVGLDALEVDLPRRAPGRRWRRARHRSALPAALPASARSPG